jgi:flavorubredoxin
MNSIEVAPGVSWVGAVDASLEEFHGFTTEHGTTYNAYLVHDTKTALIDSVKAAFSEQLLGTLEKLKVRPNYLICNHAEPDHAGSLGELALRYPEATVVCSKKCAPVLKRQFDTSNWKIQEVSTGDRISLGQRSLEFIETPMVHWPESMFSYIPEEQLLFSMDAFGQHLATAQRFDEDLEWQLLYQEAKSYYANIIMPLGKFVAKTLKQVETYPVKTIAPSHGVIWRKHINEMISAYKDWCICRPKAKVLVLFDTMWGSTEIMAEALAAGVTDENVDVKLLNLRHQTLTDVATEVIDSACVALGSASLNGGPMPMLAAALSYLKGLKPTPRQGIVFGSYGWDKACAKYLQSCFESMQWKEVSEPILSRYNPDPDTLEKCRTTGQILAAQATQVAKTSN